MFFFLTCLDNQQEFSSKVASVERTIRELQTEQESLAAMVHVSQFYLYNLILVFLKNGELQSNSEKKS